MFLIKRQPVLLICIAATIGILLLKYIYPELMYFNSGFVLVILLTIFLEEDFYTRLFGFISVFVIAISWALSKTVRAEELLIPHLLAAFVAVISTFLILQIKKLNRANERDKRQMNALFEFATEGIILVNEKGEIELINPAALKLLGYQKEELLHKPVEIFIPEGFHYTPGDYRDLKDTSNRSTRDGTGLLARTKTGKEFPVEVSLSYFQQKSHKYIIAFIVDITDRKEAEQRLIEQKDKLEQVTADIRKLNASLENKVEERTLILREALQELEKSQHDLSNALSNERELNEIKSRFVSMASHEFRTPLSTVLSSATLISKYPHTEEQDKRERHIRRIKDSVKHLNDLLEDFLSLGKLEEGKITAKTERFPVKEFLEDVTEEMKANVKPGQQISVNYEGTDDFETDKNLLKNIMINLISNGVKFSGESSIVDVRARKVNHKLLIDVKDEGIGISEEDKQHLFTSFFRGKNAMNIQGTGLGLHLVNRYVNLLNGFLKVESNLGHGTTFSIEIPELKKKAVSELNE